jgi:hypothetical protein
MFVAVAAGLFALGPIDGAWPDWRPATCLPDACFCENIRTGFVRQPINTWSNLSFVFVGLLILSAASADRSSARSNPITSHQSYTSVYGFAVIAIGFGSMVYHASLTFIGQWLDVMSMYLLGTFMVVYNVSRLRPIDDARFTIAYLLLNIALDVLLIVWPDARRYLFGALIGVALIIEAIICRTRQPIIQTRWLFAALATYIIAQIIWTLDLNRVMCEPNGWLQGHAIWHVLTAASAGLLYLYYRSESN